MTQPMAALLLSAAARQAGRLAGRALLRRMSQNRGEAGEIVRIAVLLRDEAQEVLARAVVYERSRGTSWATIGRALNMSRQSAFKQFHDAEQALHLLSRTPTDDLERLAGEIERLREVLAREGDSG